MPCSGTRKCLHCHTFFKPNPRSKGRQIYCSLSDCQKASKTASQQKWLQKPENQNYFRGPEQVARVQRWRANHPGYSKKSNTSSDSKDTLQDALIVQPVDKQQETGMRAQEPLQELLLAQPSVLIGLIAHLTGSTLQDEIVRTGIRLRELGEDFLSNPTGGHYGNLSCTQPPTTAAHPRTI